MGDRTRLVGLDGADIELLERLGAVATVVDPVPDHVREIAGRTVRLPGPRRRADGRGRGSTETGSGGRGTSPTSRMHFFEFGELSIDVELTVSSEFMKWSAW